MTSGLFTFMVGGGVNVFGGPSSGTQYSLEDACPTCGAGAVQRGPLLLRPFKLPKAELFRLLTGEILASPRIADVLRGSGIQRCIRGVLNAKTRESLAAVQLVAEATLPRFTSQSTGVTRERPCPGCDRDGFFGIPHVPMILKYRNLGLFSADLFATYERFGNSRLRSPFAESTLASPMYVGSDRLVDALRAQKIKGLSFEPVEFL